ncbi:MAG: hypothetical protein RJA99_1555 [Pseudomonadota bacterium]|jgi:hypothetical protein
MDAHTGPDAGIHGSERSAALDALLVVLLELVRFAMDQGVRIGQFEELVKRAMVLAALRTAGTASGGEQVSVSRLSVMTGIHRKEVKRLLESVGEDRVRFRPSPISQLFLRWANDPSWQDPAGRPLVLPRRIDRGDVRSFEKLARSVTTDVHPTTLLDELLRLGLVAHDPTHDTVSLSAFERLPADELHRLLEFAAVSIADHVAAVRENIAALQRHGRYAPGVAPFLEQWVYADELSAESARDAKLRATEHWRDVVRQLLPTLGSLETADRAAGRPATHRLRMGVYCYIEPLDR